MRVWAQDEVITLREASVLSERELSMQGEIAPVPLNSDRGNQLRLKRALPMSAGQRKERPPGSCGEDRCIANST
jgi:hypothetical protein